MYRVQRITNTCNHNNDRILLPCNNAKKYQTETKSQTTPAPAPAPVQSQAQTQSQPSTAADSALVLAEEDHTPLTDATSPPISPAGRDMHALFTPVTISLPIRTKLPVGGKEETTNSGEGLAAVGFDACTEPYCGGTDVRGLASSVRPKCVVGECWRED